MTYKQNENSKTSLNDFLEKRVFRKIEASGLRLHELNIGHIDVKMTKRYVKANSHNYKLETYKSIVPSSSNQLNAISPSQFRHEQTLLHFLKLAFFYLRYSE